MGTGLVSAVTKDAYDKLKQRLTGRGAEAKGVADALLDVEQNSKSKGRRVVLEEELEALGVHRDAELLGLAKSLVDALRGEKELPAVANQILQTGSGAVASGQDATAAGERGVANRGEISHSPIVTGDGNDVTTIGTAHGITIKSAVFQTPAAPNQPDPRHLLWTYLNQIVRDTEFLDLSGVDRKAASDSEDARLRLAAVFTMLDTLRSAEPPGDPGKRHHDLSPRSPEAAARESVAAFVDGAPHAVLLGDPGSGKTTFANFLALVLAGDLLGDETVNRSLLGDSWKSGPRLPLRVVLRDFAAQLESNSKETPGEQLLRHFVGSLGAGLAGFEPLLCKHLVEDGGILILDGFDEVPAAHHRREIVKQAVLDLRRSFPRLRFLLTSRTYAYQRQQWRLPDFTEAVLAPFSDEQVQAFVGHWYAHVCTVRRNLTPDAAKGRATLLQHAIDRSPYLRELARRPLLLTLMASLHAWRGGTLPGQREELYEESVNLLLDFWEKPKTVVGSDGRPVLQTESAAEWLNTPRQQVREALEGLAFKIHAEQPDRTGAADMKEQDLVQALVAAAGADTRPARVVEYIRDRAGLLINRAEGVYGFPHRTFQEYLAARHLTVAGFPDKLVELARDDIERWREVVLLAGAKAARGAHHSAWSLVAALCPDPYEPRETGRPVDRDWGLVMLAGQILTETGIHRAAELSKVNRNSLDRVRDWLAALVGGGHLPAVDRAAAGVTLGRLGDPRKGVGLISEGGPDIDWIEIPAGPFTMGADKPAAKYDDEMPQFSCGLITRPYGISRYPVTVAQYACFVRAGGYEEARFWTEAGWTWRQEKQIDGPIDFGEVYQTPNHPRVGVSWFEATAFCGWLAEALGRSISLPSESQWERAARHTDGSVYPWGNEEACKTHCNMGETGIGHTSAVGAFPSGNAECGAADMAGNVLEWCQTQWLEDYEEYARKVNDGPEGTGARVLRGGAFNNDSNDVRCAIRDRNAPDNRDLNVGFRVVASPFSEL